MTSSFFEKWLRKLDFQIIIISDRKIVMVLSNCPAYTDISGLTNIRPLLLAPNTTAKTQLMDSGVTRCLKTHYKKSLVELCLLVFEENKDIKVNVLKALRLLRQE